MYGRPLPYRDNPTNHVGVKDEAFAKTEMGDSIRPFANLARHFMEVSLMKKHSKKEIYLWAIGVLVACGVLGITGRAIYRKGIRDFIKEAYAVGFRMVDENGQEMLNLMRIVNDGAV